MPPQEAATELVHVGQRPDGTWIQLAPRAATQWRAMRAAAERDRVPLMLISGYRSVQRQAELLQRKLASGCSLDEALRVVAYPGHSEHHTGRAIDLGAPGTEPLTEAFAQTRQFAWLSAHAAAFGFSLSYPPDGDRGIVYEPWHWCLDPSFAG